MSPLRILRPPSDAAAGLESQVVLLHWVTLAGAVGYGVGAVADWVSRGEVAVAYWASFLLFVAGLLLLRHRGLQRWISYPLIVVPWLFALWEARVAFGIEALGLTPLLILTILAMLLWRPAAAAALTSGTVLGAAWIYWEQVHGHVAPRGLSAWQGLVAFVAIEIAGAFITWIAVRAMNEARARAQEQASRAWDEVKRREAAEAQLQRAMRMEAVGRRAGGIAHDFNNLLTAVASNLESVRAGMEADDEVRARLGSALEAVARGSRLTRQLLAYARKDTLHPRPVEVGELLESMHHLLRRTLGEKVSVALSLPKDLWCCRADPGQFEAALLNLAINARDAMEGGGELFISAANEVLGPGDVPEVLVGGRYVSVTVQDNGAGMSAEVLRRACEPFFTTKGEARGTGLGLSMVQGFAARSGGAFVLDSAEGQGTTARILLPWAEDGASSLDSTDRVHGRGHGQLVLVVEDDPDVREASVALFRALGYRPLPAPDADKALTLLERFEPALLFSDVVLPGGTNGPALARRARELYPDLPVLLTSGYTGDEIGNLEDFELIQKPFRARELRERLEHLLDNTRRTQELKL